MPNSKQKKSQNKPVLPHSATQGSAHEQVTIHQQQIHQGPLPSPVALNQYDQVVPGAAERILQMAEHDAQHQRDISIMALDAHRREVRLGQVLGFGIGVLSFSTCIVALFLGSEKTAIAIGGTTVIGLVTAFVKGRTPINKNDKKSNTSINTK